LRRKIFIVDDDRIFIKLMSKFLTAENQVVEYCTSSTRALSEILIKKPDCILLDMMMPEIDGLELLKQLRNEKSLDNIKIIIVSGKSYEFDRKRAFDFGADGYIVKPVDPDKIFGQIEKIIEDKVEMIFWGVRGTLPVPGKKTIRYGGNTSCMSLEFTRGNFCMFDAGTGIKGLSDYIMAEKKQLVGARIFISHPHWDHINAMPYFVPMYTPGNEIEICGPAHGDITMRELISGQMNGVYFPIKIKEFSATIYFRDLQEEQFAIDGINISTMLLNHPGHCLGYRVEYKGKVICYVTDNELYPKSSQFYNEFYIEQLTEFIRGADAFITDSTYTDKEYAAKMGWGHSAVEQVVELANSAGIKKLYLFHHDPDQTDDDIDRKLEKAQTLLLKMNSKTTCIAPTEQQRFLI